MAAWLVNEKSGYIISEISYKVPTEWPISGITTHIVNHQIPGQYCTMLT
jgi:hypothetical protein